MSTTGTMDMVTLLDTIREVPLDQLPLETADEIIARLTENGHKEPVVPVARFGSAI